jgi:predicted component of type VI protein secretion system
VGSALNQVQVDRWKLSRDLKAQVHSDVGSIQQDLSSELPALFQAAQQSPAALEPQLGVMHNVDALYDVLVRIATTANISGGKIDAAILDNALQRLESARKTAAGQLMQAASTEDQQIARFRASIQAAQAAESSADGQPKTIIVNNSGTHRKRHRKPAPRHKVAPAANTPGGTATPPPAVP